MSQIKDCEDFGVIGVAGCPEEIFNQKRIIYSTIIHGPNKHKVGREIKNAIKVQTVDECFFIQKNDRNVTFTERNGWHLYAVEQCLKKIREGKNNYVVPAKLWHMSDGKSLDPSYVIQLNHLISDYKKDFKYINTTVKKWKTNGVCARFYLFYYYNKQFAKRVLYRCLKK